MQNEPIELCKISATSIGVDKEVIRVIEDLPTDQFNEMRSLLRLFESRFLNLLLNQTFSQFSSLTDEQRETYVLKYALSSLALKRKGFQALKRLICLVNYGYVPSGQRENPNWHEIGYSGRGQDGIQKNTKIIKETIPEAGKSLSCDVCVVGSGAGGSVIAEHLSARGWKVIVVEAGDYLAAEDFVGKQEYEMTTRLFEQSGRASTRDLSFSLLEGSGVGGSTIVNWNTCIKPEAWLRKEWEEEEGVSNLQSSAFDSCIDYIWQELKVNRDESELNPNNEVLFRGCKALGYKMPDEYDLIYRNAVGCDERCSYCTHGCQFACKQSTSLNLLPEAFLHGTSFVFGSRVEHVNISSGHASGVSAVYRGKFSFEVKSSAVILAAGSINTPAILLRSGLKRKTGENLKLHPTTAVAGLYDKPINMWEGPPQTCKVTRERNLDGNYHGYWLEAVPAHPSLYASASPWSGGLRHKEIMKEMSKSSASIVLVREKRAGRITIDKHGSPQCDYKLGKEEKEWMIKGIVELGKILLVSGAKRISTLHQDELRVESTNQLSSDVDRFDSEVRRRGIVPNKVALFSAHI
ncbi:MAG: GMC family oxidoreductase N-terminal domain-containing protein [Nitrososphaerales archaeon]